MIQIEPVKAFTDNYIWLARTNEGVLVVDPGDSKPVIDFLTKNSLHLDGILITHHHFDHTGGIEELLKKYSISEVIGPPNCHKDINIEVTEGDSVNIIGLNFKVIEVPGHTLDHIAFYLEIDAESHLFCGDTIFSSGCGRVFEGTFKQMHDSISKLSKLPDSTKIYCAHEYTLSNLAFAKLAEPNNKKILEREIEVKNLQARDIPSIPTTFAKEKEFNPFLRCAEKDMIDSLINKFNLTNTDPVNIFSELRRWKDSL